MAAAMHLARYFRGIGKARLLHDRQGIHIGAQADHLAGCAAAALQDPDDTRLADAGHHLVKAEVTQLLGHDPRRAVQVEAQLRMLMEVTPPGVSLRHEARRYGC